MHEYDDGMNKSIDLGGVSYGFVFFWVVDEMTIIYDGSTSTELVRRATYKSRWPRLFHGDGGYVCLMFISRVRESNRAVFGLVD